MRRRVGAVAAALVCAAVACDAAAFAQGTAARGGLAPAPRKTREELVRAWDLNADGTIDKGEAEVAASRMRIERAELRLNSGLDPVTGLPRSLAAGDVDADDADLAIEPEDPVEEPSKAPEADDSPALPGTRVPRPRAPTPGTPRTGARGGATTTPAEPGTRAAADRARQPLTGGVRAGGLPARAGYGAGVPAAPLNAGLPIAPRPAPVARQPQPRGGLVPAPRTASPPTRPSVSRDLYDPH